jgi:hypothetical protein
MTREPYNLPEPLMKMLDERGFHPAFVVPSAIGLPADPGVSQDDWDAANAALRADGERLLDHLGSSGPVSVVHRASGSHAGPVSQTSAGLVRVQLDQTK